MGDNRRTPFFKNVNEFEYLIPHIMDCSYQDINQKMGHSHSNELISTISMGGMCIGTYITSTLRTQDFWNY